MSERTKSIATVTGLAEIVLNVHDLDAALAFYRDLLGLTVISPPERTNPIFLRAGDANADLPALVVLVQMKGEKSIASDFVKAVCNYWYSADSMRTVKMSLEIHYTNKSHQSNPETYEQEISLDELTGMSSDTRSPSTYALGEISPAIARTTERIRQLDESMAAQASFALMTGDILILAPEHWKWREKELAGAKERLQRLHTEPWRRWANGFSCLCFVLVGAPMAIRLKHAEFLAIFFVCFLPILLVYYPMLAVSVDQAKDGAFPPPAPCLCEQQSA